MEKSPIEPLLEEVKPLFTEDIVEAPLSTKFKMPQIHVYGGKRDLTKHLQLLGSGWSCEAQ